MDDEPTGSIETEVSVEVGGSVTGNIEVEGDIDFVSVELEAGVTYQFDLEGQLTASGTLEDPFLGGIFDSNNVSVAPLNDDGGVATNGRIIFTPSVSGTYYVSVSHFDNTGQIDTGTYTLYVAEESLSTRPDPVTTVSVTDTGTDLVDGLTGNQVYSPDEDGITRITYSFPELEATFVQSFELEDGTDLTLTNIPVSAEARTIFEAGLAQASAVANVEFSLIIEDGIDFGTLRLSGNSVDSGNVLGVAALPSRFPSAGDIFLFEDLIASDKSLPDTTLHELGHALGLTHAQENLFPDEFAGFEFTLLTPSFKSTFFPNANSASQGPTNFSYADILALRSLYGARDDANGGDNTYTFNLSTNYWETIFDLGGNDTIRITGSGKSVSIDLSPDSDFLNGRFIDVGTTITFFKGSTTLGTNSDTVFVSPETVIENLIAADGDDLLTGNSVNNRLTGNAGDDTLNGANGDDTLFGGSGDDSLIGGLGDDIFFGGKTGGNTSDINDAIIGNEGDDLVFAGGGNDEITGGIGIDTLFGGDGNDTISGNDGADLIYGSAGDDVISGGNGADILRGNSGDDTLTGDNGKDIFSFSSGDGDDIITDFAIGDDTLRLRTTTTDFTSIADVQAAATAATINGQSGVLIDTGGGDSIFLVDVTVNSLTEVDFIF